MLTEVGSRQFSAVPVEQLYTQLKCAKDGLTTGEAAERLKRQDKLFRTESQFKKELKLLFRQFFNPLVLLLVVAVLLSAILGESSDAYIILFILLITGLLGFWQEVNAGRAFDRLKKMIEMKHTVLRNGSTVEVATAGIVAGDVLKLAAGDIIPADCRVVESDELHVNESTLTGESYPVEKAPGEVDATLPLARKHNCLWQGTNVVSGTARALVVNTGSQTLFGQMAHSLTQTPETAFEKGIRRFGFFLLRITIILALVILIANLYFKKPLFDAVLFSLALAVGMAPELLPAIMTFAMSAGARRMMKKKVIVKKLSSIFNFGEMNVLCTDKTGTITEGNVKVKDIVDAYGIASNEIRLYAWLNAYLQNGFPNPLDKAIVSLNLSLNGYEKINEIPYDFIRKRLSVAVRNEQQRIFITKGAFTNVLEVCTSVRSKNGDIEPISADIRDEIEKRFIAYSEDGCRVLGLAVKQLENEKINRRDEQQMTFVGYILLEDPLKESAQASIEKLEKMHIGIKIITGDNRYAALHAAQKIGMKNPVVLIGEDLDKLSPEALVIKAKQTDVFSETEPHQKERIVKALQKSHFTVAYLGDGINDVAAINAADIGISTNNAVDVAKEAADFVFLEKDLAVLAEGVYEGRRSFANSMKYIFITTGATFGNMLSVACASLFLPFLPMLPKQILLTNLITDFPFLTIAADRVDEDQLTMPGQWNLNLIRNFMITYGLHSSLFDLATFYILYFHFRLSESPFQTGWFMESVITEILIIFIVRTRKFILKSKPGKLLVITSSIAVLMAVVLPLSPFADILGLSIAHTRQVIAIILLLLAYVITGEWLKRWFFKRSAQKG